MPALCLPFRVCAYSEQRKEAMKRAQKREARRKLHMRGPQPTTPAIARARILSGGCPSHLEVRKIPRYRGVGVYTTASIARGEMLVRYCGRTISLKEAENLHEARAMGRRVAVFVSNAH